MINSLCNITQNAITITYKMHTLQNINYHLQFYIHVQHFLSLTIDIIQRMSK